MESHLGNGVGSSRSAKNIKNTSSSVDWLSRDMLEMKIRDKTEADEDRDSEPDIIDGVGAEPGHVIRTTLRGRNGQSRQTVSYIAEHVVGTGSFGMVFQAKCRETGEVVAIKKVLQDKRYKNRELQIMQMLDHPNVVCLKHSFYSRTENEEVYLNLVLEFVPETVNRTARSYSRMNQLMPLIYVKLYAYQICRGLGYLHNCCGLCHRDIKPQNLLVNPHTHQLKICDFGSAKVLVKGEPNISYICSRYYRAPELIFGATEYTTAIDIWSTGCVMAELLLGQNKEELSNLLFVHVDFVSSARHITIKSSYRRSRSRCGIVVVCSSCSSRSLSMESNSGLSHGNEAEDVPGGVVVAINPPDPRWPYMHRWTQNSPPPLAKSPAVVPSPVVPNPNPQPLIASPIDLAATVSVVPPIAPVVTGNKKSTSAANESKSLPDSSLPPVDGAVIVKSSVSESLISPPLRGAWERKLKFNTLSADQQVESGVPISKHKHSHYDSSKDDDMRFPWAAKMDPAARNLYRATSPEYMEDGTPKVTIPSHVLLQGLENQKEYVLGQFYRCSPPSGGLIHAVINRIWGRKCRIFMRKLDDSKFLFHIPDASTRAWVLQRGLWHVDDCLMFVAPWSTADTFDLPEISTIPVWVTLKNIPNRLYSIPGISHIASGLGAPMATYKPRLDPSLMGEAKVLVEVELSKAFPPRIAAADKKGNISMVNVEYSWVPTTCGDCGQLGHKASRCMKPHLPHERVTKIVSEDVIIPATVSLSSATDLVSPITLQTEPPIVVPTADSEVQIDTALEIEAGPIQDKDNCNRVADCQTIVEAEAVTEAIPTVESVNEIAGTKDNAILSDREIQHVLAKHKFTRLGSSFSDGDSLSSDGDSIVSADSDTDTGSGLLELMTPSGQRLLRERPVKPSIKAKEIQVSSNTRGRGNRGRGNRGRGNRGRG